MSELFVCPRCGGLKLTIRATEGYESLYPKPERSKSEYTWEKSIKAHFELQCECGIEFHYWPTQVIDDQARGNWRFELRMMDELVERAMEEGVEEWNHREAQ